MPPRWSPAGATGNYRISLLTPGQYTLTISAPGFETSAATVAISIGQVNSQDVQLAVGSSAQTVEVTGTEVPLLHTENANITTTFDMQQVQTLPNPGNDLTFVAQTAPGVVMNTAERLRQLLCLRSSGDLEHLHRQRRI